MVAGSEVALPVGAADAADGAGHLVAVDADVRRAGAGAHRDRGGLAASPALAVTAVPAPAPLADPLPGAVAAGGRLDLAAVRALGGVQAGGARLAHAPAGRAEQRDPVPAAARAPGRGQCRRAARDQLGHQVPGGRRCPVPEHARPAAAAAASTGQLGQDPDPRIRPGALADLGAGRPIGTCSASIMARSSSITSRDTAGSGSEASQPRPGPLQHPAGRS